MNADRDDDDTLAEGADEALALLPTALEPRRPSPERRERLIAVLRGRERFAPFVDEVGRAFGVAPDALRAALACIPDPDAWQPGLWPGSRLLSTPELARVQTVIASLPPGSTIAAHEHPYRELTYVLDGTLVEDGERRFGPGELIDARPGTRHAIAASDEGVCLVVFGISLP